MKFQASHAYVHLCPADPACRCHARANFFCQKTRITNNSRRIAATNREKNSSIRRKCIIHKRKFPTAFLRGALSHMYTIYIQVTREIARCRARLPRNYWIINCRAGAREIFRLLRHRERSEFPTTEVSLSPSHYARTCRICRAMRFEPGAAFVFRADRKICLSRGDRQMFEGPADYWGRRRQQGRHPLRPSPREEEEEEDDESFDNALSATREGAEGF